MSSNKKLWHLSLASTLAMAWAIPAQAQSTAAVPAGSSEQAPDTGSSISEDIVVTARKTSERAQDVPIALSAFSGAALQNHSVRELQDLGSLAPNLFIQQVGSEPQARVISIRGQRANDILLSIDPSVGLYVDGVNIPRTYGLAGAMVDVGRVEVLRGPQGTLYGKNTTGGAVSLFSNDPADELGGSASATVGNYGRLDLEGILNIPITDKVGVRFVAQRSTFSGYGHSQVQKLADEDGQYYRMVVKAEPAPGWIARFSASYSSNKSNGGIVKIRGLTSAADSQRFCGRPAPGLAGCTATLVAIVETLLAENPAATAAQRGAALADPARQAAAVAALNSYINAPDFYSTGSDMQQSSTFKGVQLALNLEAPITDSISIHSISGYNNIDRTLVQDGDGTPFDIVALLPFITKNDFYSEELQLIGKFGSKFSWQTGGFISRETGSEAQTTRTVDVLSAANPRPSFAAVKNTGKALYGQFNWSPIQDLTFTGGYRYSWDKRSATLNNRNAAVPCLIPAPGVATVVQSPFNPATAQCPRTYADDFKAPSWLVSLSYKPNSDLLAYAKIARGYKTGGENIRGSVTALSLLPFQPETLTEYEVGFKSDWFDRALRLNVAAFYDDYSNIQKTVILSQGGVLATLVQNAAKGSVKGFEAESTLRLGPVTFNGSLGYLEGKYSQFIDDRLGDRSSEPFPIPSWTANVSARYEHSFDMGKFAIQADYQWLSRVIYTPETPNRAAVTQPAYGLLNGRMSMGFADNTLEVALFARNILQKEYIVNTSSFELAGLGFIFGNAGSPRTFGIQIKKRFGGI